MLKVLPTHISNLIAAGEVVQRPSSVVKELMENAIDAEAKNISVIISDSGRTLIQVTDDGIGMSQEDAKLCFSRHATSKISEAEDLHSIMTYGFRGEALPSIAAVSEVSLKSRTSEMETGTEVVFAESQFVSQEPASSPQGTTISVRNLFYNVPARRKFLKSEAAEFRHILSEFSRVALCHPEVGFKLIHNKKEIYSLRPALHIKQRIIEIAGKEMNRELVDVDVSTQMLKIHGFIGTPEDSKKTPGNQYFFVNGRFFKSPYLHKAILKGYEHLIPEGYTPSYFLFFEIAPDNIDINIHPAKIEVKFEDESIVFAVLCSAVREVLGKNSFAPSIDFDTEGVPEIPIPLKNTYIPPPKIDFDPLFNPFDISPKEETSTKGLVAGYGELFENSYVAGASLLQLHGKFIVTPVKSGILLINVARAKERIFYERFLNSLDSTLPIAQQMLFESTLELDPTAFSIVAEEMELLKTLGFEISLTEPRSIIVSALPDGFPSDVNSVKTIIDQLIASISEIGDTSLIKAEQRSRMAASLAKAGVKPASSNMSNIEAQLLVDTLFGCNEPNYTPDGRSCMTIITMDELDKKL